MLMKANSDSEINSHESSDEDLFQSYKTNDDNEN